MIEVVDKSKLVGNSEETAKSEDNAVEAGRLEKAEKSTKDSKKVKLGESGGISF